MKPLEGITVLDLSRVLAGPYCGQLLADFGADVIKIEDPAGDEARHWFPKAGPDSTNFLSVNRGKKGMTLNLKSPEGREVLDALVRKADVLIHSFLPKVGERLGITYDRIHALNPDLVFCSISGYGSEGPMSEMPGYDLMVQAFSGIMSLTGDPDRSPSRAGVSTIDLSTSMLLFGGITTALLARATGRAAGQHVKISLLETSIALLGYHAVGYLNTGFLATRAGSGVGHIVPYQAFPTADGSILTGATNDVMFRRLCSVIGAAGLADDVLFATIAARRANKEMLVTQLEGIFRGRPTAEWIEVLTHAGVPTSPINTVDEVLAHPQVEAMEMIATAHAADGSSLKLVGVPIKLSDTPGAPGIHPPRLGEHTDHILTEVLGMDESDVRRLREAGAL